MIGSGSYVRKFARQFQPQGIMNSRPVSKCRHGLRYLCPKCGLKIDKVRGAPVPAIWITDAHGRTFVHEALWEELEWLRISRGGH